MITIGSDPEFGLMGQDGKQVMAHRYLPDDTSTPIGCDGHRDIGELRPKYGETPREHLGSIANLIAEVGVKIPSHIKVTAGSMVTCDPIGGHIHFGGYGKRFDIRKALHALDYYLALPVALIEVQSSARTRRTKSCYGRLGGLGRDHGGYRIQNWGFEYRTLPSWMLGWGVALSVLSIGYAVVDAVNSKSCPDIPKNIPNPRAFDNCDKEALSPLLSQIRGGWRELPLYPKFRLEMAFLNHLLVRNLEWREGQDIRRFWPSAKIKAQPSPYHVLGNPKDYGCPQIAALVRGIDGTKVFIYGLNPDREPDIAINDLSIISDLPDFSYEVQSTMFGVAREYDGWLCIGLSYVLRQDFHAAADLINRILRTDIEQYRIGNTQGYRDRHGRFQSRQQMLRQR